MKISKREIITVFTNIVFFIALGFFIYGLYFPLRIYTTDGLPTVIEAHALSLQERFLQFPADMEKAMSTMLFYVIVAFVLYATSHYLNSRLANAAPMNEDSKRFYEKSWQNQKIVYSIIKPLRTQRMSWDECKAQVEIKDINLPSSIDSLKDIFRKGERGEYETENSSNFP